LNQCLLLALTLPTITLFFSTTSAAMSAVASPEVQAPLPTPVRHSWREPQEATAGVPCNHLWPDRDPLTRKHAAFLRQKAAVRGKHLHFGAGVTSMPGEDEFCDLPGKKPAPVVHNERARNVPEYSTLSGTG